MCVNIGHGDARVIKAIQDQAATLAYANPFMATEARARLSQKLASISPGDTLSRPLARARIFSATVFPTATPAVA